MKMETANLERQELHELIVRAIAPLPVSLISTVSEDGIYNAAPFSLIMPVSWKPPVLCVSMGLRRGQKKDTLSNIESTGDFVVNIMDESLIQPTVQTSANYARNVDEMAKVGLTAIAADRVKSPRVAEAQVSLECRLIQQIQFSEGADLRNVIFGEVLLVHLKDELLVSGKIDPGRLMAVGHMGTGIYCRARDIFKLKPRRD